MPHYVHHSAVPFEVLAKISGPFGTRFERLVVNACAKKLVYTYALDDIQSVPGESVKIMSVQPKRQLDIWRAAHGDVEVSVERLEWINKIAAELNDVESGIMVSLLRQRVAQVSLPKDHRKAYDRLRRRRARLAKAEALKQAA